MVCDERAVRHPNSTLGSSFITTSAYNKAHLEFSFLVGVHSKTWSCTLKIWKTTIYDSPARSLCLIKQFNSSCHEGNIRGYRLLGGLIIPSPLHYPSITNDLHVTIAMGPIGIFSDFDALMLTSPSFGSYQDDLILKPLLIDQSVFGVWISTITFIVTIGSPTWEFVRMLDSWARASRLVAWNQLSPYSC